ncbi:SMODS domain-containing nucleotidyltransferase [Deinococcus navajonensis]|uniref:Nucleotidyltransferase-like protein n=1 Tax=Deinococcus navajonensis TaxID=309884 RepID=A0ABV8XPV3_9DEIO
MSYLQSILDKYQPQTDVLPVAQAITEELQQAFPTLSAITVSGSYAKGTAVSVGDVGTEVDLLLSFAPETSTPKGIYEDIYQYALQRGWMPRQRNVALGVQVNGHRIDLIPARQQAGFQHYHSVYIRKASAWRQTNVEEHIDLVRRSRRTDEIRLLKIWRTLHVVEFPSFYLEMFIIEALKGRPYDVMENVWYLLGYMRTSLEIFPVLDPTNPQNLISDTITALQKQAVAAAAIHSLQAHDWSEVIW